MYKNLQNVFLTIFLFSLSILFYRLTVWNADIEQITIGAAYLIEDVNVRTYNEELFLSTTKSSSIRPSTVIVLEHEHANEVSIPVKRDIAAPTISSIIGVRKIDSSRVCHICLKKTEQKINPKRVHCPTCNMTRLTNKCSIKDIQGVCKCAVRKCAHVINFFAEHLQFLLDATDDDLPQLVSELTHEEERWQNVQVELVSLLRRLRRWTSV